MPKRSDILPTGHPDGDPCAHTVLTTPFFGLLARSCWKRLCAILSLALGVLHAGARNEARPNILITLEREFRRTFILPAP